MMVKLFGQEWTQAQLRRYAGNLDQVGGVTLGELADGRGRGIRTADVETGSGLSYQVLLDRGMDIGACRYNGASISWFGNPGAVHPAYYEKDGLGWLRTFHGGLVTGCGVTEAGAPCTDEGQELGLHGRLSHTPATNIWADGNWRGDEYEMWVRGKMRQAVVFGENITVSRRVWSRLGESRIMLRDVVVNEGFQTTPHMMLYHCNFGFPLLADGAELITPAKSIVPRDELSAQGQAIQPTYEAPVPGYVEQCFYHDMLCDDAGYVTVLLANRTYNDGQGLGAYLRYRQAELPLFTQWKNVCAGTYVTGLEPANCWVEGRDKDRAEGRLQFLEPGESREYLLEIGILANNAEIDALEGTLVQPL